jgi:alkanesulfonate monooxygenase SsuD/methylene tetrahydromethanopterin reductase-like flavin-dependent oxidoreductase (luciferase family)
MGPAQPDILARQVEWITDGIAAAGRRRDDVRICYITTMSISDDVASAVHDVRSWASAQARLQAEVEHLPQSLQPFSDEIAHAKADYDYREHLSTHAAHQGTISDALVKTLAVAGTADDCLPRIAALADTGVDQLIFPLMGSGRLHRLERLVREVAPILN